VRGTVAVVTDSAADLPEAWKAGHEILVVPLTVRLGHRDLLDGAELDATTFWSRCRAGEAASTASPSPAAFADAFRQAAERGAAEVVCIDLASGLSSTVQSASVAAADAPLPVHVVDSGSASLGQAMVVLAAARAAAGGAAGAPVVDRARSEAGRVRVLAVIDQRHHLQRSGRLGSSGSVTGSVLAVKPIVEVRGGQVVPVGRQRTMPRALEALAALVADTRPQEVAVVHGDADPRSVDHLVAALAATGPTPSVHLLGPVVGAHLGPGAVGVAVRTAPDDR